MTGPQSSVAVLSQLGDWNWALSSPPTIMTIACASTPFPSFPHLCPSGCPSLCHLPLSPQLTFNIFLPLLPRRTKLFVMFPIDFHQSKSMRKPAGQVTRRTCFFSCPPHSLDPCAAFPRPPLLLVWDFLCFLLDDVHRPGVITKWYAHMMLWFTVTLLTNGIPGPTCHCNLRTTCTAFFSVPFPFWHFPCLSEPALPTENVWSSYQL